MGLDWCLKRQVRAGHEDRVKELDDEINKKTEEVNKLWAAFLAEKGEGQPFYWPNALSDGFYARPNIKEMSAAIDLAKMKQKASLVLPAEALDAPRVGHDDTADNWVHGAWDTEVNKDGHATPDEWIAAKKGEYLLHLADSDGLGKVTGMFVSPTSFRGKILRFVDDLSDDLKNEAYEDHDPDELVNYGRELKDAAESMPDGEGKDDTLNAATWCLFWGGHDFGMHAWY